MRRLLKEGSIALLVLASAFTFNVSRAADDHLNCVLSDTKGGEMKETFAPTTAEIFLTCDANGLKEGDKITASWIAADTHKAAPDNHKITDKILDIPANATNIDVSVTIPDKGWPVGSYHVDLLKDDETVPFQSIPFSIQ